MLVGESVHCYVCNSGEHYEGQQCETDTLNQTLLANCDVEGLKDNKKYTMCRKFIQQGNTTVHFHQIVNFG